MLFARNFLGCLFILTYWYSPAEIHSRMTIFYCGASAAGAFSGLLSYGIGHLDYTWGFRGWHLLHRRGFIIMMVTSRYLHLPGVTLFGVFLTMAGLYPTSTAVTAWIALNCAGSTKCAVGIGAMMSFSQLGGIVSSNIYFAGQAPTYPGGFGTSLRMLVVCGIIWPLVYRFNLKGIYRKRAAIPLEEIQAKYTEQHQSWVTAVRYLGARVDCVYAGRDKLLTVPESYLRSLKAAGIEDEVTTTSDTGKDGFGHHTVETPAAEAFLAKVNQLRHDTTFSATSDPSPIEQGSANDSAKSSLLSSSYDYFRLTFDTSHSPTSLNLSPYLYANHCLEQMEIYMGHDYHWFLRRRFKERMDLTYKTSGSLGSRDRLWRCRLLIVFALGETFVNYHLGPTANQPNGQDRHQEQDTVITRPPPPGTAFFEQALVLLKLPFEEPSLEHLEILNLAV
ncbi:hypothetical protein ACJA88_014457 [Fusarium oxysporum]